MKKIEAIALLIGCGDPNYYGTALIFELEQAKWKLDPRKKSTITLRSVVFLPKNSTGTTGNN